MENKKGKLRMAQWILMVLGVLTAFSLFGKGFRGVLGGIVVLASAFLISPLFEKTKVLEFNKPLRTAAQFVGAFILLLLGCGIAPNNTEKEEIQKKKKFQKLQPQLWKIQLLYRKQQKQQQKSLIRPLMNEKTGVLVILLLSTV